MRPIRKAKVFVLLFLFGAASSFAADQVAIHLHFTTAKQNCPLQIL